jgi:hypothetical protein
MYPALFPINSPGYRRYKIVIEDAQIITRGAELDIFAK